MNYRQDLSGLEYMRRIVDGSLPHPTIATSIPMVFREVESGRILLEVTATEAHLNPLGTTHGGFAAAVLDEATGSAVHSMLKPGENPATIELNVKMLRPVPQRTSLLAEGRVINLSKSLGVAEGSIRDSAGKLYAHATCTCMILRDC